VDSKEDEEANALAIVMVILPLTKTTMVEEEHSIVVMEWSATEAEVIVEEDSVETVVDLEEEETVDSAVVTVVDMVIETTEEVIVAVTGRRGVSTVERLAICHVSAPRVLFAFILERKQFNRGPRDDGVGGNKCFNCGGAGHFSRECTEGSYFLTSEKKPFNRGPREEIGGNMSRQDNFRHDNNRNQNDNPRERKPDVKVDSTGLQPEEY
jgi:hypothetical protein